MADTLDPKAVSVETPATMQLGGWPEYVCEILCFDQAVQTVRTAVERLGLTVAAVDQRADGMSVVLIPVGTDEIPMDLQDYLWLTEASLITARCPAGPLRTWCARFAESR